MRKLWIGIALCTLAACQKEKSPAPVPIRAEEKVESHRSLEELIHAYEKEDWDRMEKSLGEGVWKDKIKSLSVSLKPFMSREEDRLLIKKLLIAKVEISKKDGKNQVIPVRISHRDLPLIVGKVEKRIMKEIFIKPSVQPERVKALLLEEAEKIPPKEEELEVFMDEKNPEKIDATEKNDAFFEALTAGATSDKIQKYLSNLP